MNAQRKAKAKPVLALTPVVVATLPLERATGRVRENAAMRECAGMSLERGSEDAGSLCPSVAFALIAPVISGDRAVKIEEQLV